MKTNHCNHLNAEVTIDVCMKCRLLCVDNPRLREAGIHSSAFIHRWGYEEITNFLVGKEGAEKIKVL